MEKKTRFLIGRGERLVKKVTGKSSYSPSEPVYNLPEARERLADEVASVCAEVASLSDDVCPGGIAVAKVQLNPSYIARSYFPGKFLRHVNMHSVGSRNIFLKPDKWKRKSSPEEAETTELFVAGDKAAFSELPGKIVELMEDTDPAIEFARIERIASYGDGPKVVDQVNDQFEGKQYFEVCLHVNNNLTASIVEAFEQYAEKLGVKVHDEYQFDAGGLWFAPVYGDMSSVQKLSMFSMVRLIRAMPKLRGIKPLERGANVDLSCKLTKLGPLSKDISVAILDGGLPDTNVVDPWLDGYVKLNPNAKDDVDGNEHGLGVTSAFLFGPINPEVESNRPYSFVTNVRLLDGETGEDDPLELYQALAYIEELLQSRRFEYINLSLGPDLPVEDGDVHAWTSVIDHNLADGSVFMAVAAGNNGNADHASGNARVQIPSDCINATAVGASNSDNKVWSRAPYSAIGPGRNPGVIKPDMLAFGGSSSEYFHVLSGSNLPKVIPNMGTSFASPYLLRQAVGVRATLGRDIKPLVVKSLLVHSCQSSGADGVQHVGWGRMPSDLDEIITSPDGVARIVYQGELTASKYVRAEIPLPSYQLKGKVSIKATMCYACDIDPQDSGAYSKAGVDITFRPHHKKTKKNEKGDDLVKTRSFFKQHDYATESDKRKYAQKWETTLHGCEKLLGSSLERPSFELHHIAREAAGDPQKPRSIRYALVISIEAKHHNDLYADILENYAEILTALEPTIEVPIEV